MHVTPYLYFNGHCREAFAHYQRVLGGELMLMTYAQMPPDTRDDGCADVSAAAPDQVMHVTLAAGSATADGLGHAARPARAGRLQHRGRSELR